MGIGYVRIILKTSALKKNREEARKAGLNKIGLVPVAYPTTLYTSVTSHQRKEEAWLFQRGKTLRYAVYKYNVCSNVIESKS